MLNINVHHHFPDDRAANDRVAELLSRVVHQLEIHMSTIAEFIAQQNAFNAANAEALTSISGSVDGLTGDIANLSAQVAALQGATGLTAEEQAALDAATVQAGDISARLAGLKDALAALDALTPPVAPVEPPPAV